MGQRKQQTGGGAEHPALTVFVTQNDRYSREERPQKVTRNSEDTQEQENNQRPYETDLQEAGSWIVTTIETVRLAQRVKQIVIGKVELPKRRSFPS